MTAARLAVMVAALALMPAANAQFFDKLKNAVNSATAAANAASDAAKSLTPDGRRPEESPAASAASAPAAAPATMAAAAPKRKPGCPGSRTPALAPLGQRPEGFPESLWPTEGPCDTFSFADYKFDAGKAQKIAFDNASKVRCGDCEGGYSFDGWINHHLDKAEQKMLALKTGEKIQWKGGKYHGTIVLTGEQPVGTFPCRQYHWTLKDPKTGQVAAERDGMYCEWQGGYSTKPSWNEVI
jgi:hypothetical protein